MRIPKQQPGIDLPVPEKLYFTIGEVALLCDLKAHVLRYWEQEFQSLKPLKRRGNRRYYKRADVFLVRRIKSLLYREGFTIEGARAQLTHHAMEQAKPKVTDPLLQEIFSELEALSFRLKQGV